MEQAQPVRKSAPLWPREGGASHAGTDPPTDVLALFVSARLSRIRLGRHRTGYQDNPGGSIPTPELPRQNSVRNL